MGELPTGTVSFLFTDLEGSTRLWEERPGAMKEAVALHDGILEGVIASAGGHVFSTAGDAFAAAFWRPEDAIRAAVEAQRALGSAAWPGGCGLRARMGVHSGTADERGGDYFGSAVNRAARLMAAGHGGQVLVSRATEEMVGDDPPFGVVLRDLGEHRLKDLSRPERIFQIEAEGLVSGFPALNTLESTANNLPTQLSSFVGRGRELDRLDELVGRYRLVTLTGVGGTGKTRLAVEYGAQASERFPDGVYLVELATVADPSLVVERVATTLSVQQTGRAERSELEHLAACLRDQRMLVILDNCEHVVDASATLSEALVQGCNHVSILATSREALGVDGEHVMRVPSLTAPDDDLEVDELLACESARLFVERAQSADSDFSLSESDASTLGVLCRRLDGIPLAIELAAARVGSLSLAAMVKRLDDQFQLLTGGRRTAVERHQTLRAAIDWSYQLLGDDARSLFPRLAVFTGGWTLDAAEAVCADDRLGPTAVLDALSELVDKSMVALDQADGRYRMVEPLRQYALEQLADSGETETLRDRHATWIEDRFALTGYEDVAKLANDLEWMARGVGEHPNVVDAVRWLIHRGDAATASRILAGTWPGVFATGRHSEALELADAVLRCDDVPCWARYFVQNLAAHHAFWCGDVDDARRRRERAIDIGDACPEVTSLYMAHLDEGLTAYVAGGLRELASQFETAQHEAAAEGNPYNAHSAVYWLGLVAASDGDYDRAVRLLDDAYQPVKELPFGWVPYTPSHIARFKVFAGHDDVEEMLEEADAVARGSGDPMAIANALTARAAAGPTGRAVAALDESFRLIQRHGLILLPCVEAAALVAEHRGGAVHLARVLGALSTLADIAANAEWRRWLTSVRERLAEDDFKEHFEAGARAGPESVIESLLADGAETSQTDPV